MLQTSKLEKIEIYPIGSIYLSVNDTNPNKWFNGTWEQIAKGRTLVGVDTSQTEFNTVKKIGGEKTHTLTINEMPSHGHTIVVDKAGIDIGTSLYGANIIQSSSNWGDTNMVTSSGGSQSHNNMQPYFTCYIWCRVA